jgi:hypothetical protein
MEQIMGFMDILNRYVEQQPGQAVPDAGDHMYEVAQSAPREVVSHGLAEAFRTDQTPPFGQMVAQLFGQSNPQQRAGLLNHVLGALGPGGLGGLAGGAGGPGGMAGGGLGDLLRQFTAGGGKQITADQANSLDPEQVNEIATRAQQQDPGIVDRVSDFYAQHPTLVKALGSAALTIALAKMANRGRN